MWRWRAVDALILSFWLSLTMQCTKGNKTGSLHNNFLLLMEKSWFKPHPLSMLRICDIFLFALLARAGVLVLFNGLLALFFLFICVFREFETFLQLGWSIYFRIL